MPRSQRFGAFVLAAAVIGTLTGSTAAFAALPATQAASSEEPVKEASASEPSEEPKTSEIPEAPASLASEPSEDPKTPEASGLEASAAPTSETPASSTSEAVEDEEEAEEVKTGKVDFRLYRDENLNNTYDDEDSHDGYVNLLNKDTGEWFKVVPGSLQKQGLPAGTYRVYMRDVSVADGFGAVVDAKCKRLPFAELKERNDATYIDEDSGETAETVTDTGRFVTTTIEVKAGETVTAHFASSRIDASAKINDEGVESVYFKDGDTKLDAFASDAGFLASADAEKKTRHFFTEDKVTLGVNLKEGRRVVKVEVKPSATRGGETRVLYEADTSAPSADPEAMPAAAPVAFAGDEQEPTEFSIERKAMGDDFGRFEFVVTTGPKEDSTEEPTDEPTDDPTEEPSQDPTEDATDGATDDSSAAPAPGGAGESGATGSTGGTTENSSGSSTGSAADSSSSQKG